MKKILLIAILVFSTYSFSVLNKTDLLIEKEIKAVFNIENYTKQSISVSKEINGMLPIKIKDTNFFKIENKDKLLGYYYFGHAYGKADYFDFIVIFDKELIISKVKVLVYREDHGGEVGSKRWLSQFMGKSGEDSLDDIDGISGATISVRSMTNAMKDILKTMKILQIKKVI